MKGWLSLLFIFAGLIWMTTNIVHADQAVIQVDRLNVRSGPSLSDPIIGQANNSETYRIVNEKNDWTQIEWNDKKGWVASYLVKIKQEESLTSKVDYLRVREQPGMDGKLRGYLMKNIQVTKKKQQGDWVLISSAKVSGWVHSDYLSTYTHSNSKGKKETTSNTKSLGQVTVTTAVINVRTQGSTNTSIITQVGKGKTFDYVSESKGWFQIRLDNNKTGWVAGWLVTDKKSSTSTPKVQSSKITLLYNGTNIRSGPSSNNKVVGHGHKGDQFDVLGKEGQWYKISYKDMEAYVAGWIVKAGSSSTPPQPSNKKSDSLSGKTIMIDAGHGGFDPGAIGANGSYEKTLTLQTTKKLKNAIEQNGAHVMMTRSNDSYVSLSARTILSNTSKADVFVSIHYNSFPKDISVSGIGTYYYHSNSKSVASNIQSSLAEAVDLRDRGIKHGDFHVLKNNKKPAVLLELGFLSNPTEERIVKSSVFQNKVTQGVVNGLISYFD
ncbi:N-acetylmuramoyl-L-alanine amidase [Halobacillus amylolyticus]|uniref:N-acetylmuramoyl-L-alanine amidase n=1 Tax=Halobacillus amylolyticus TaxID=2932259 RepID=A0ABY4HD66_9BACI|nr:N-acetylmuramoyl-L-alanine amidase [Halobacillus amylolyticus]UOR12213.1 N-acetylmuramoyl-L-alanine amidase [Halobacillus amylolyticus]